MPLYRGTIQIGHPEQVDYNLLFRWFVGLGMDDTVWNRITVGADKAYDTKDFRQYGAGVERDTARYEKGKGQRRQSGPQHQR